jgi:hypothetical protein
MTSFTEQAVLSVVDKSTGPTKKVNAALRDLFKTARQLKSYIAFVRQSLADVRLTPGSDQIADISICPLCAKERTRYRGSALRAGPEPVAPTE